MIIVKLFYGLFCLLLVASCSSVQQKQHLSSDGLASKIINRAPASAKKTFIIQGPLQEAQLQIQKIIEDNKGTPIEITLCGQLEFSGAVFLRSDLTIQGCTDSKGKRENKLVAKENSQFTAFFSKSYQEIELKNVTLTNLIINGNRGEDYRYSVKNFISITSHSRAGVTNRVSNFRIIRNHIKGFLGNGILIHRDAKYQSNPLVFKDILINNNYIADVYISAAIQLADGVPRGLATYSQPNTNIKITQNTLHRIGGKAHDYSADNKIAGFGILVNGVKNIVVSKNNIRWFKEEAVRINNSSIVFIKYNTIKDSYTIDEYPGGIKVNRVINASIWANYVQNTEKAGIEILGGHTITVRDNTLSNNRNHGIRIADNTGVPGVADFLTRKIFIKKNKYTLIKGLNIALIGVLAQEQTQKDRDINIDH